MTISLRIKSIVWEGPNVLSFDLRPLDGGELPPFTAGAHIDLKLPNGLVRSYSLTNSQAERHRYVIAVQKDRASRGGSRWIHENARAGEVVSIDGPRNNLLLNEAAEKSVFIAGGIGITPILSMIDRLSELRRDWNLVYCSRRRSTTAFLAALENRPQVRLNFDEDAGGSMLDIAALARAAPANAHLYCCGPTPMLDAFTQATKDRNRVQVHFEYFTSNEVPALEGGFTVVLARSGKELVVAAGKSILATLLDAGIDVPHSCMQGVCGTCETRVLEGTPDHRDVILTGEERASGKIIMICCSGAKSEKLVLDI